MGSEYDKLDGDRQYIKITMPDENYDVVLNILDKFGLVKRLLNNGDKAVVGPITDEDLSWLLSDCIPLRTNDNLSTMCGGEHHSLDLEFSCTKYESVEIVRMSEILFDRYNEYFTPNK
jgi:hypothetical protein|nr:MAG TPA: hypothetical protein [Caudoviricetes sp.]